MGGGIEHLTVLIKKIVTSPSPVQGSPFRILTGFLKMTGADGERFSTGAFTRGLLVALGYRILVLLCSTVGEEKNEYNRQNSDNLFWAITFDWSVLWTAELYFRCSFHGYPSWP